MTRTSESRGALARLVRAAVEEIVVEKIATRRRRRRQRAVRYHGRSAVVVATAVTFGPEAAVVVVVVVAATVRGECPLSASSLASASGSFGSRIAPTTRTGFAVVRVGVRVRFVVSVWDST